MRHNAPMTRRSTPAAPPASPGASSPLGEEPGSRELGALFHRLAAGDGGALEALYERYGDELYGLALWSCGSPEDAADAVQETFVRLAQAGETLRRVERPRGYLFTICRRAALDRTPARRRVMEPLTLEAAALLVEEAGPAEARLDAATATRHLTALPAPQREAVYLRCFTDLSFAEIGETLGIPTFTAASRYRLGIERLRRLLVPSGGTRP
jgi:RNA polymerase sigma-70 factor, ECF subfamily